MIALELREPAEPCVSGRHGKEYQVLSRKRYRQTLKLASNRRLAAPNTHLRSSTQLQPLTHQLAAAFMRILVMPSATLAHRRGSGPFQRMC